jgi:ATP-dependent DNA helicase RecG
MKNKFTPQDIKSIVQVGSGIGRIKEVLKDAKLPAPAFSTDGMFTVVFHRIEVESSGKGSGKGSWKSSWKSSWKGSVDNWAAYKEKIIEVSPIKLGKSALKILEMVYENQTVTMLEMAKKIGITELGIAKNIKTLRDNNILERRDSERSGYWKIIIPEDIDE